MDHNAARRGFTKRSTTYNCGVCKRLTRSTGRGDNENVQLCIECYEVAGIENGINDGHYEGDELIKAEEDIKRLNAIIVSKGGIISQE